MATTHFDESPLAAPLTLVRGSARAERRGGRPMRLAALRAPLAVKVIGANLSVLAALALFFLVAPAGGWGVGVVAVAVTVAILAYVALVIVALRPVNDLESVATRVWLGDYGARVASSATADADVVRIGSMFNILLDGLSADRARMQKLATEVLKAGERERAALARELHDSTAQRLAAILMQLGAMARDTTDPVAAGRLEQLREMMHEVLEEVRLLSHTVHPRVLDDLGLVAALQNLARETSSGTGIDIDVEAPRDLADLSPSVSTVLYRVAQESVRNAVRHASPRVVRICLTVDHATATLEVRDDGRGFDVPGAEARRPGMGLFTMRERVALVDGRFDIRSAPGGGTSVLAVVPLTDAGLER